MTTATLGAAAQISGRPGALNKAPEIAQVVFVNPNGTVNLAGFDHEGRPFTAIGVPFRQDGAAAPKAPLWADALGAKPAVAAAKPAPRPAPLPAPAARIAPRPAPLPAPSR